MKAKALILIVFLMFVGPASADLNFSIRESCQSDEEPMISMHSKTGGNIGEPGHFKWQVCGNGVEEINIKDTCASGENSLISMFQRNDSHASINQEYRWDVCSSGFRTNLTQNCDNPIASMESESDSHVAKPDYYSLKLCPSLAKPENTTIKLELDAANVYIDDSEAEERAYTPLELSYPYIVSDQPVGLVSFGKLVSLSYETRGSTDIFRMTQSLGSTSVLLPFTGDGYSDVEDDEEAVIDRSFLDDYGPSFGFSSLETPFVRVRATFDHSVEGFDNVEYGQTSLSIRNKVNNNESTEIILTPVG